MLSKLVPSLLIVDDDEECLTELKKILSELDIIIHTANSGEAALHAMVHYEYFLILMDICMPGMDGLETVSLIRGHETYQHVPIIFITEKNEKVILEQTYKEGIVDIIFKPVLLTDPLICKVSVFLELYINKKKLEHTIAGLQETQQNSIAKEQQHREILDSLMDAVITIDEAGIITSINKTTESMFGYSADELLGQKINGLMPEPYFREHDNYLKNYLDTFEPRILGVGRELVGLRKNKEIFPLRIWVARLPPDGKGKYRFIGTCHDLTDIKLQEKQLQRVQKMDALGKLTGGIAHDYNNMLGIILGYSEILTKEVGDRPELLSYVNHIYRAGKRGVNLTNKLMDFSRKKVTTEKCVNINSLLRHQQLMLEKTLTARIDLVFDLEENVWDTWLDDGNLEDAILNISINAMHAIKGVGLLTIRTSNESINQQEAILLSLTAGDYVVVRIADSGSGMDRKTKDKIFEPFFTTKGERGTGLGLSQVYAFVYSQGGVIKVDSTPDIGTLFTLYFHRYDRGEISKESQMPARFEDYTGTETILLVDDEPSLLSLNSEILSKYGFKVISAGNAKTALAILERQPVNILICDVIMPGMDGYELASIVKKRYPNIKIQLASGYTDDRSAMPVDQKLQKELLHKPFESKVLLERLHELLAEEE